MAEYVCPWLFYREKKKQQQKTGCTIQIKMWNDNTPPLSCGRHITLKKLMKFAH